MITLDATNLASGIIIVIFLGTLVYFSFLRRSINKSYFQKRWTKLEVMCTDQKSWCEAIVDADNLLNEALKKKHYKGKTTGERLVAAQRELSSNHTVWFGHKLRNKIDDKSLSKVPRKDAKLALTGFHKALKDLGALSADSKSKGKAHA